MNHLRRLPFAVGAANHVRHLLSRLFDVDPCWGVLYHLTVWVVTGEVRPMARAAPG